MPASLSAPFSVTPLISLANQLRSNPKDGETLAKTVRQIGVYIQQISNQLDTAGFSVDQLGHLSILAQDIRELTSRFGYEDPPDIQYFSAATYRVPFLGRWMRLSNTSAGPLTLTSTPTIATPAPNIYSRGPIVELCRVGSQAIVLQDHGTLANSGLALGAATRSLGTISLRFVGDRGLWVEQWYSAA